LIVPLISGCVEKEFVHYIPDEVIDLTYEDKDYLISVAYMAVNDTFSGNNQTYDWLEKFDGVNNKVFIGFRINGEKKGSWSATKDNLAESVYTATVRTLEDQRYDGSITEEDVPDLKIEIFILGEYMPLDDNYEPGIHGLRFEKNDTEATYYNSVAIEGNYQTEKLMSKLCTKADLDENCCDDPTVNKYYFNTLHFATTRFSEDIITFYRCNIVDFYPNMTMDKIEESLHMAQDWFLDNLRDEGDFNYRYSPSNGKYSTENNMIRQFMASRLLAELCQKNSSLQDMHRKNLDYVFEQWYREDNETGYIFYDNKSKIGANAMALRTLIYSPFFDEYTDEYKKIAHGIISLQHPNGSFEPWYIEPDYIYDKQNLLYYYSGQAILSLVELYDKTGNDTYLDAAVKSQDYYLVEYVENLNQTYYPALVPWHTISLSKLYDTTGKQEYTDAIFVLNDELIKMQNQNGYPSIDYLGRFYDPSHPEYGIPFSGSTAIYVEGLAYAYKRARQVHDRDRMESYLKSIILGIHNLINLQFKGSSMYYLQHPERVEGAIRYRVDNNRIRIDTTQHTIDGFMKILDVFENEGDTTWNYVYNPETGELAEYYPERQDYTLLVLVGVIIILGGGFAYYIVTKNKAKKQEQAKKASQKKKSNKKSGKK